MGSKTSLIEKVALHDDSRRGARSVSWAPFITLTSPPGSTGSCAAPHGPDRAEGGIAYQAAVVVAVTLAVPFAEGVAKVARAGVAGGAIAPGALGGSEGVHVVIF